MSIDWTSERSFHVSAGEGEVTWDVELGSSPVPRLMNALAALVPPRAWRSQVLLAAMGRIAGSALRAGRVRLYGRVPNTQSFMTNPLKMWLITQSQARVRGVDLGPVGAVAEQVRLGDFWLPQRGLFVLAHAYFTQLPPGVELSVQRSQPSPPISAERTG